MSSGCRVLHRMAPPLPPPHRKVTNAIDPGTNSQRGVTTAPPRSWLRRIAELPARRALAALWGLSALWMLVHAAIHSVSVASDLRHRGVPFHPAEPWIWEVSSALSLLIWLLPVVAFDERLRERVRGWVLRLGVYVLASALFSVLHVATMVALRHAAYAAGGGHYDFGPWLDGLVYEYRKDALTFLFILLVAAAWRMFVAHERGVPASAADAASEPPPTAVPAAPPTFLVRTAQGDLLIRADEIDWVEAQGNYVALHVQGQPRLLRHTLAEMETRLKEHGFIRTHRRALVNRARMQAILPPEHGEPGVRLSSGQVAPLSESRRAEVVRLVLGTPG